MLPSPSSVLRESRKLIIHKSSLIKKRHHQLRYLHTYQFPRMIDLSCLILGFRLVKRFITRSFDCFVPIISNFYCIFGYGFTDSLKATPNRCYNSCEFHLLRYITFLIRITKKPLNHAVSDDWKTLCWFGDMFAEILVIPKKNNIPEFCDPRINNNKNCHEFVLINNEKDQVFRQYLTPKK